MSVPLKTVLVGAGRVGAGYADDAVMARHYPVASHAQALATHPRFEWGALVEPDAARRAAAAARWKVPLAVADVADLGARYRPDVAVLAVPPEARLAAVERLEGLRAVLVEKPLGRTPDEAAAFLSACEERGVRVQVNLHRRADALTRELAAGGLAARIGRPQVAFGVYGNGIHNNGTHMVDLARLLLGEVQAVRATTPFLDYRRPDPSDRHVAFVLEHDSGTLSHFAPLDFRHYRENALDVWGTEGRLEVGLEGLVVQCFTRSPNRAMSDEYEVSIDVPERLPATIGSSFYRMYDDLAEGLNRGRPFCSPPSEALRTARVVEAVVASADADGRRVSLGDRA